MNRITIIALLILTQLSLQSQNLLSFSWKFHEGDDPVWSGSDYDDTSWNEIIGGNDWETQGHAGYDGFAWYRQQVLIPSSMKKEAKLKGGLSLQLGVIDDVDQTFWNGEKVGETGQLPPNIISAYNKPRNYTIPFDQIVWGEKNLIAVRVYDNAGNGGIIGDKITLTLPGASPLVRVTPQFKRPDHLYLQKSEVKIGLKIENGSNTSVFGKINMEATSDFGKAIFSKSMDVTIKSGKTLTPEMNFGNLAPGFYQIKVSFIAKNNNARTTFSIGVRPEEIISPTNRPDDFGAYWQKAKEELSCIEPQYNLIKQDSLSTATRNVYVLEMRSLGNVLVRGWYTRPVKSGVYPAILHVQGYSTFAQQSWGYPGDDMISLVLNIRGHGFSQDFINPGFPGYLQYMVEDKELYIYRGAYMDCIRAMDFLFEQEEVDKKRVAVEGGSQGGALSIATAALDNERVALCVPHVPFLSDFEDYFKVAGWPGGEFERYFESRPASKETVMKTLSYIDIKNLAPWIKVPVFMGVGLVDTVCPPHINFAAYNQVTTPKNYVVYPEAGHSMPAEFHMAKYNFIRKHFGMEK